MNLFKKTTPLVRPVRPAVVPTWITVPGSEDLVRMVRSHIKATRLAAAYEEMLVVQARVEPTPTYDAVVEVLGWNPRTDLT